jgi:hypothetical protein
VAQVATDIDPGLAKAALAGNGNGRLVDTSHLIEHDAQVTIGPVIEDDFYFYFAFKRRSRRNIWRCSRRRCASWCRPTSRSSDG